MWCQMDLSRINNPNRRLTHSPWRSVKIQQLLQNNYFLNVYNTKRKKYLEVNAFDNLTINHNVRKYATNKTVFVNIIRKHQREDWIDNNICVKSNYFSTDLKSYADKDQTEERRTVICFNISEISLDRKPKLTIFQINICITTFYISQAILFGQIKVLKHCCKLKYSWFFIYVSN